MTDSYEAVIQQEVESVGSIGNTFQSLIKTFKENQPQIKTSEVMQLSCLTTNISDHYFEFYNNINGRKSRVKREMDVE